MSDWFGTTAASGSLLLAIPVAFAAGLVSFFSPCVVPLLPGYLSYVTGVGVQDFQMAQRRRMVLGAVLFVLGFSAVFVAGGALFGFLGRELIEYQRPIAIVTGVVTILLGLAFLGRFGWLQRDVRVHAVPAVGLAAAPLLGFFFGLGWTPCLGPTLTAVLGLSLADDTASAARGAGLTAVYSLGLGVPFVLAALGIDRMTTTIDWVKRNRGVVSAIGGVMLIVVGVLLVTGIWNDLVNELLTWTTGFEVIV